MAGRDKLTSEDVLDINEILSKIERIDLDKIQIEREEKKDDVTKLIEKMSKNETVRRIVTGKGRPKGRAHWKARRHRRRDYDRKVAYPKKKEKLAATLVNPEGWYAYLIRGWQMKKIPIGLTLEEFTEHLYPFILEGKVPTFRRYDTKKGLTLGNLIMRDTSGAVLWDGKEHQLRLGGYVL
jgi:hypothetical protein